MAKVIRINLPINRPDKTITLSERILLKHTNLGVASPLSGFTDMAIFSTNLTNACTLRTNGDLRAETKEKKYDDASVMAGVAKGQTKDTKGTIYWNVQKVRNAMSNKFKGSEESLTEFGFNVVITQSGGKRIVSIKLPYKSVEKMTKLGEDILARHTLMGVGSPLNGIGSIDLPELTTLTTGTRALLDEWEVMKGEAQSFHNQALQIIGYGAGQTTFTAGTLYFDICQVRDRLLDVHQGHEESLSEYSFDVVVRMARKRKKNGGGGFETVVREGNLPFPGIGNVDFTNLNPPITTNMLFAATGAALRFYASATPNGSILATTPFFDVQPGQIIEKSIAEVIMELGLGGDTPFLNVQNMGPAAANYEVTIG